MQSREREEENKKNEIQAERRRLMREAAVRSELSKKRLEESKLFKEQSRKDLKRFNIKFIKRINSGRKQPLFKEIEDQFAQKQEEARLQRKQVIEEIKMKHAPLDLNKIIEHARKHDAFVERMRSENRSRRSLKSPARSESAVSHYRSKFYQRNLEQERTRQEMEEAKAELKLLLEQKKKSYARYVAQVY